MSQLSVRVYRLPRLSYSPINATPVQVCCRSPSPIWRTIDNRISEPSNPARSRSVTSRPRIRASIDERSVAAQHGPSLGLLAWAARSSRCAWVSQLWGEHDPQSAFHRFVGAVAPHKYRSPAREQNLKTARQLLHLIDHWDRTFPEKFFPRFATRFGRPEVP